MTTWSLSKKLGFGQKMMDILDLFKEKGLGMRFSFQVPQAYELQYMDLTVWFLGSHTCWLYRPRSVNQLMKFDSGHPKNVKSGIAKSCLWSSL